MQSPYQVLNGQYAERWCSAAHIGKAPFNYPGYPTEAEADIAHTPQADPEGASSKPWGQVALTALKGSTQSPESVPHEA